MRGETRTYNESAMDDSDASDEDLKELSEQAEHMRNQCAHVYDDPDAGAMLDQLLSDAGENYGVDKASWQRLLKDTQNSLLRVEDDPVMIKDILRAAITKGLTDFK